MRWKISSSWNLQMMSSNINEVIKAFFFFCEKISDTPKALKALNGTKTLGQKHKTQISE